ncbi:MAG: Gfo/Idh/MocA family oxidoreductase [Bacteroidota bacterium]
MKQNLPKTIKWGIIGLGKIADKFAKDLSTVSNATLYGVASRNQLKADVFAKKFGANIAFDSYESLAKNPNIDAIYIATPHSFHKEHSILCLENKKAVLCEKPLAMNLQEVEDMINVAKKNNVLLMEALWTYFLPHYQHVLKIIEENSFGKIQKLEADFGFKPKMDMSSRLLKKSLGGGSLLDIGIYPIFAALTSLGIPNTINATATFFDNGADSSVDMTFNYDDDIKAHLKSTFLEETKTEAIFSFDKGTIKINSRFHEPTSVTTSQEGQEETKHFNYKTIGYSFEIEHFNNLLREEKTESDIMTFEISRKLMKLLDAVRHEISPT